MEERLRNAVPQRYSTWAAIQGKTWVMRKVDKASTIGRTDGRMTPHSVPLDKEK